MLASGPEVRVLMFSMYEDAIHANRAMQAGAFGYVTKASAPNVLVAAVQSVAGARKYMSPDVAQELALRSVTADADAPGRLSGREFEVLRQLVQGLPVREIADTMGLTPDGGQPSVGNQTEAWRRDVGAAGPHWCGDPAGAEGTGVNLVPRAAARPWRSRVRAPS